MKAFHAAVALLAVLSAFLLAGCGSKDTASGKVVFSSHSDATDFVGSVYKDIQSKASSQGVEVEFFNANRDANLQMDQLNVAIAQKPAAIILLAVDKEALIPAVEKANEAGIPVIATNRDLDGGKFAMVRSDERQAGTLQGNYMAKHLPPNAKVVYLMGESTQSSAKQRWEGFKEACLDKRPDIELLTKTDANWSEAEALKYMTLWLQIFPQIDGVVCGNDTMALGALKALKAGGRNGNVLISGVDAKKAAVAAVAAGEMAQTVKQDAAKTADSINGLLQEALKGQTPSGEVKVPFMEITRDNVEQFR